MSEVGKALTSRCAGMVADSWGRKFSCSKPASVHIDGKDWCGTHNPQKVAARRNARNEADRLGAQMQSARREVRGLERQVLAALRGGADVNGLRDKLKEADHALAVAEAAARANGKVTSFWWE